VTTDPAPLQDPSHLAASLLFREVRKRVPWFPRIVCLCGSTRFTDAWRAANLRETLAGRIVLTIGCDTKSDDMLGLDAEVKLRLDSLHFRKIELADEILVLNVGGYVGESTAREIAHARWLEKPVRWLETPTHE
jgi:hypothetical protein